MTIETSKIIIDDNLTLDVNTGVLGTSNNEVAQKTQVFPTDEVMLQLDKLENAISDLESSHDSSSISRLSKSGREGVYYNAGLITNIVLGVIIALIMILLLI